MSPHSDRAVLGACPAAPGPAEYWKTRACTGRLMRPVSRSRNPVVTTSATVLCLDSSSQATTASARCRPRSSGSPGSAVKASTPHLSRICTTSPANDPSSFPSWPLASSRRTSRLSWSYRRMRSAITGSRKARPSPSLSRRFASCSRSMTASRCAARRWYSASCSSTLPSLPARSPSGRATMLSGWSGAGADGGGDSADGGGDSAAGGASGMGGWPSGSDCGPSGSGSRPPGSTGPPPLPFAALPDCVGAFTKSIPLCLHRDQAYRPSSSPGRTRTILCGSLPLRKKSCGMVLSGSSPIAAHAWWNALFRDRPNASRAVDELGRGAGMLIGVAHDQNHDPKILPRPPEHLDQPIGRDRLGPIVWPHHQKAIRCSVAAELDHVWLVPVEVRDQVKGLRGEPWPQDDMVAEFRLVNFGEDLSYFLVQVGPGQVAGLGGKQQHRDLVRQCGHHLGREFRGARLRHRRSPTAPPHLHHRRIRPEDLAVRLARQLAADHAQRAGLLAQFFLDLCQGGGRAVRGGPDRLEIAALPGLRGSQVLGLLPDDCLQRVERRCYRPERFVDVLELPVDGGQQCRDQVCNLNLQLVQFPGKLFHPGAGVPALFALVDRPLPGPLPAAARGGLIRLPD